MCFLSIVLNIPLNQSFTYSYSNENIQKDEEFYTAEVGKRAEIMFGNRKTTGLIIAIYNELPKDCPVGIEKIRPIKKILDKDVIFPHELLETAKWLSHYYLCSLGEAVFSMIPSSAKESGLLGFNLDEDFSIEKKNILSDEQEKAINEIIEFSKTNKKNTNFHYLYGPTGSGKTEVFLQLTEQTLKNNQSVIYLVPEISLTGQVASSITQRFGDTAAILHSGLSPSQKLKQWNRILHNEAKIIIGARSAIFAPVQNLGLIIIDEEHDASYKSGNTPRYHARQVAMHRAIKNKIPLLMGSATPSVEAWHGMINQQIIAHKLTKRLSGGVLPTISCIDLNLMNMDGCISNQLEKEINICLENKKQAILFLNRRGFTHFFKCNSCGYELKCKNCSVGLTFHKNQNKLKCHYCGWSINPPSSCPSCGSLDIGTSGFGTEFIESEAKAKFPNARILRLDTDAISSKKQQLFQIEEFKKGNYDILLGTQMVAKGLNFKNLQLVGVILADSALQMPDFRAGERTFSLITQVAGRAGRYFPDGKVFVQTYSPTKEPILFSCQNKLVKFYEQELVQREMLDFPPFSRLLRIVFRSSSRQIAVQTSHEALKILLEKKQKDLEVLGPSECPIEKINSNYRFQILLKGRSIIPLQSAARRLLFEYTHNPNVYIEYDVDPVNLL